MEILKPVDPVEERIRQECEALADLLTAKHENYGGSAFQCPFLVPGLSPETAMMVRLSDKIARLRSLESGELDKVGESKLETLLDLAGYALLLRVFSQTRQKDR